MQKEMERKTIEIVNSIGNIDIIHAHDWVSGLAGIGLKHLYRKPLIATIHSTEFGRRFGLHDDFQRSIHELENWLCYEAWHLITCSKYMLDHVSWCFGQPKNRLSIIYNGVDVTQWKHSVDYEKERSKFAHNNERILLFVGRMVHEKGIDLIVKAMPNLLKKGLNVKAVLVGEGPRRKDYQRLSWDIGVGERVYFTGHIPDQTLISLYNVADAAIFPSRFEPFGIVALEAMAARCPVIVSDVGGLSEIVDHEMNGLKVPPDDPTALSLAIERIMTDNSFRNSIIQKAYEKCLEEYNWNIIAETTIDLYHRIQNEWNKGVWKPT
jgi:glycogen(starch) synthase